VRARMGEQQAGRIYKKWEEFIKNWEEMKG
jgi:hypothetical protein